MSDNEEPTTAPYPADFKVPPGMPTPTAADVQSASTVHGGGVAQETPWWVWLLGLGGLAGLAGLGYVAWTGKSSWGSFSGDKMLPAAPKAPKHKTDHVAQAIDEMLADQARTQVYR